MKNERKNETPYVSAFVARGPAFSTTLRFQARRLRRRIPGPSEEEVMSRIRTEKSTSIKGVISFNLFFLNARIMSKKVEMRIVKNNGTS